MAEALAPGQSEELLQVAQLGSNSKDVRTLDQTLNNEMVENLKQVYNLYVEQKMPFIEQVRLLSLLPAQQNMKQSSKLLDAHRMQLKWLM